MIGCCWYHGKGEGRKRLACACRMSLNKQKWTKIMAVEGVVFTQSARSESYVYASTPIHLAQPSFFSCRSQLKHTWSARSPVTSHVPTFSFYLSITSHVDFRVCRPICSDFVNLLFLYEPCPLSRSSRIGILGAISAPACDTMLAHSRSMVNTCWNEWINKLHH